MKKGFTLIELLAVIIILAVIALVATPIVMDVIDDSKESGNKSSVAMYADAIELQVTTDWFKNGNYPNVTKSWADTNVEYSGNRVTCEEVYYDTTNGVLLHKCTVGGGEVSFLDNMTVHAEDKVYCYYKKNVYTDCEDDVTYMANYTMIKTQGLSKINKILLEKYPDLALANTAEKGCATLGDNNYTYMGGCYLKGLPTENYIWFSGFMYRIMGVNTDGTIRLITEDGATSIPWGANNTAESYENSYARNWLNDYFMSNIKGTEIITNGNFCQNLTSSASNLMRTTCENANGLFNDKVGLLSIDEYNMAGATSSYLYDYQFFWTMSPYSTSNAWTSANNSSVTGGYILRPVINVNANSFISSGNGTINDYYILNDIKNDIVNKTLADVNISSGEYIKFAGKNYRTVSTDGTNVKMILDGYYPSGMNYGPEGSTTSKIPVCSICNNSSIFSWLVSGDTNYATKLKTTTWYQGYYWNGNYQSNLNSTSNSYSGNMGEIKIGEMLVNQSETMLNPSRTPNGNNISNAKVYWTLTSYSSGNSWCISNFGSTSYYGSALNNFWVRPVLNVDINNNITSGNGTPNNPYKI